MSSEDLKTLVRRALITQLELGTSELIIRKNRPAPDSRFSPAAPVITASVEEDVSPRKKKTDSVDIPELPVKPPEQVVHYRSLAAHYEAIHNCQLCPLWQTRTKFVYGTGNPKAKLIFIGEAPGADEDRIGEPFVGRAGQLLDKILVAMGLSRQEVYIANILKSRPPGNRDPLPSEVAACIPYLKEQIRIIKPQLLCALGRIAAQNLLQTTTPLGKLRGVWHEYEGIPLRVTYHPAALLRFPEYKKDTWADMQVIKARYDELAEG